MAEFVCKNCGFRLEGREKKRCPYCSMDSLEEQNAEKLIKEVEKVLD